MDLAHRIRPCQRQDVVVAFEVMAVLAQPRAAIAGLIEPQALDHGAHGAIEEHDALGEQPLQPLDACAPLGFIARLDGEGRRAGRACAVASGLLAIAIGTRCRRDGSVTVHGPVRTSGLHVSAPAAAVDACGSGRSPSA